MSIFRSLEYRSGVAFEFFVDIAWYIVQFALLRTAYNYVPQVGGYTLQEAYIFLAFLYMNDAVSMIFFNGGIGHITRSIRTGALDFYLLKPMPTLFQMTMKRVNLPGLLNVFLVIAFWLFIFLNFDLQYPKERWAWAGLLFLNGMVVNVTFRLSFACMSFWTVEGGSLNWLSNELLRFGTKPETIYGRRAKTVLTTVMPVLLLSAWPCLVLIRETTPFERTYPFFVAAGSTLVLFCIWRAGVRRYEGLSFQD